MPSPATFDEAVAYANELGWVIYQLNQACCDQDPPWRCTLREGEGEARRNICHGKGDTPVEAIFVALSEAPEAEPEAITYNGKVEQTLDLLALIGASRPNLQITRRR